MRLIRKSGLVGLTALMLSLAGASAPWADVLESSTGVVGTATGITGTSTNLHLVETWFGFAQVIDCTHAVFSGTAAQANVVGGAVKVNVTSIATTGCTNTSDRNAACTYTASASSANPAGLILDDAASGNTTGDATVQLANWSGSSTVTITMANCLLGGSSCSSTGLGSPNHTMTGAFENANSTLSITAASGNNAAGPCGQGKWTGDYVVKTSSGHLLKVTFS